MQTEWNPLCKGERFIFFQNYEILKSLCQNPPTQYLLIRRDVFKATQTSEHLSLHL